MSELAEALTIIDRSKGKTGQASLDDLKRADDLLEVALATNPSNVAIFVAIGHLHACAQSALFLRPFGAVFHLLTFVSQSTCPCSKGAYAQHV